MAEKKSTAKRKTSTKKTKKEVVDTGAAQEFVEMMVNKPVSEIETKVDEENNTVIVKAKVENSIDMIEVTTTVVEPEQQENSITVDVQEDDNHMTIQGHPDPVGELGPSGDDCLSILPTEGIVSFGNIDEKVNDKVDSEIRKMAGEIANAYGKFFENLKGVDDNIENEVEGIKNKEMPIVYVTTHMGISYD